MISKIDALLLLLLVSYSTASKRQKYDLKIRKQFEYLESMIHRNAFSLRDDLYTLHEQVNASVQAWPNGLIQEDTNVCRTDNLKDELGVPRERIAVFARGIFVEKKVSHTEKNNKTNFGLLSICLILDLLSSRTEILNLKMNLVSWN